MFIDCRSFDGNFLYNDTAPQFLSRYIMDDELRDFRKVFSYTILRPRLKPIRIDIYIPHNYLAVIFRTSKHQVIHSAVHHERIMQLYHHSVQMFLSQWVFRLGLLAFGCLAKRGTAIASCRLAPRALRIGESEEERDGQRKKKFGSCLHVVSCLFNFTFAGAGPVPVPARHHLVRNRQSRCLLSPCEM